MRLIDSSGTAPIVDASGVNLGAVGGTSAYSADTVALTTQISSSNRPVLSTQTPLIPDFNAPNDYNKLGPRVNPNDPYSASEQHFPDDGLVPPAEGRGYRPSLYGEPIIPQVWLTGSVGSRFIIEQQQSVIAVPSDLFNDTNPTAELQYDARMPGGAPLPPWLAFDARNLTFTGTPPEGSHGTVEVEIVAHDQFGNQATATFQITVGRESKDIEQMLSHLHQGEYYAWQGNLKGAIDQFEIASKAKDGDFYQASVVDTRLRALKREFAEQEHVEIRTYEIIYNLLDDVQNAMLGLLEPEFEEVVTGEAEVREIFSVPRVGKIAGCLVQSGVITRNSKVRFLREGVIIWKGTVSSLKRFKEDVTEVRAGFECGIGLSDFQDLKPGDVIETFEEREIPRT